MKNLILAVVFILGIATSFAGNNVVSEENIDCIHVTLSCGVEYDICNFSGTTIQLINSVLNSNNNVCGTNFDMIPIP